MTSGEFRNQLIKRASIARIEMSDALAEQLETYYRLLVHWNSRINLTSLPLSPTTDQAVDRLFIEPLAAARHLPSDSPVWFDVGSGGGSPAIPLRLVSRAGELIMVEPREKKAAFLREVVRALRIDNTSVRAMRIEEVADSLQTHGTADLITVRAVKIEPNILEAFRALLRPAGFLLFFGAKPEQLHTLTGFEVAQSHVDVVRPDALLLKRTA